MKLFKELGVYVAVLIAAVLLVVFVVKPVIVDGHSMDPTLADKERLLIALPVKINRQDIVVAKEYNVTTQESRYIAKRVIGMPGDTVSFDNDELRINGKVVKEPYLANYQAQFKKDKLQNTYKYNKGFQNIAKSLNAFTVDAQGNKTFTVTVPKGQYFLLGDDRAISSDSRAVGTFTRKNIVGKAILRIWPLQNIKLLN